MSTTFRATDRTLPSTAVLASLVYLESKGVDTTSAYEAFDLSREDLERPLSRMPARDAHVINQWLEQRFDEPHIHLKGALNPPPGMYHALDYMLSAAPTLGHGVRTLNTFAALMHQGMKFDIRQTNRGEVVFQFIDVTTMMLDYERESVLVAIAQRARHVTGNTSSVRAIHLHRPSAAPALLRRVLPFDLVHDPHGMDAIIFDKASWNSPTNAPDMPLWQLMKEVAQQYMPPELLLIEQVRAFITHALPSQEQSISDAAGMLRLSPRTLQRLLKKEGTSYSALLEQVRLSLARQLIRDDRLNMDEVATKLGFREQSSMTRAFKRWFGKTPSQVRASHNDQEKP